MTGARPTVLVIGYYGEGNAGDEAVLGVVLRGIRAAAPDARCVVPTYGAVASATMAERHGVDTFAHFDIAAMLDAVQGADAVVVGGGGLLHDYQHPRPHTIFTGEHFGLSYYCGIPWLASRLGKPVVIYAAGVGPFQFAESHPLVRDLARGASAITVRDAASGEILRGLAGEDVAVEVTADAAWLVEPAAIDPSQREGRWLGVAVRNWNLGTDQGRWEAELLAALRTLATRLDMGLRFLPFQSATTFLQNDRELARRLADSLPETRCEIIEAASPETLAAAVGSCDLVVAMRLHSVIFACLTGTPFVALDYDPKVALHAALVDPTPPVLPIGDFTRHELVAAAETVWMEHGEWSSRVRRVAETQRERAARNDEVLATALRDAGNPLSRRDADRLLMRLRERADAGATSSQESVEVPRPWGTPRRVSLLPQESRNVVRIVAPAFFDLAGGGPVLGGAERYLLELARVLAAMGQHVEIFQPGSTTWLRELLGFPVHGLPCADASHLEAAIAEVAPYRPLLTIHLAFYTVGVHTPPPSIGISHGIYWDAPESQLPGQRQRLIGQLLDAFDRLDTIVSVDANTINWVRATCARLADRCHHLPNFVDVSEFRPAPREARARPVVMFPRRAVAARGLWLLEPILGDLLDVADLWLVSPASGDERSRIESWLAQWPGALRWNPLAPDEMAAAYSRADIVLIPTVHSEGTSLSCLEAQASGCAVVATNVGGLAELVQDGVNGLLIEPHPAALRAAVLRLVRDPDLRRELGEGAVRSSRAFALERWQERWKGLLAAYLGREASRHVAS